MFYHVCFVVPDIERAMRDLTESVNAQWSGVLEDSLGEWDYLLAFTRGGPPYVELVQGPPGSPWDSSLGARCHHLGYWTEDVDRSSARLSGAGFEQEFSACPLGRPYAYHKVPSLGVDVELMDISRQQRFVASWDPGTPHMPAFDSASPA
ncbi:VOC family protein [Streptomyces sp. NPDC057245]|uniref:VOC family protein n=1 Tax=Streptomyces TaxID=1883 RepID=UPI0027E55FDB|nr:VOC family protein [Streptomyces sp. A108]